MKNVMILYNIKALIPAKKITSKGKSCYYFQVVSQDFIMKAWAGLELTASEYWVIIALNKYKLIY